MLLADILEERTLREILNGQHKIIKLKTDGLRIQDKSEPGTQRNIICPTVYYTLTQT